MQHVACGKKTGVRGHGKYSWLNPERGWMYEYLWHEEKECLNLPRRRALLYIATFSMKVTDIADFHGKICDLLTPWKRYELHPNLEMWLNAQTQHM